jgi:hypothetical protein
MSEHGAANNQQPITCAADLRQVIKTVSSPKLRRAGWVIPALTWSLVVAGGWRSGYFKVSGIGAPIRSKASRWWLVGSARTGPVVVVASAKRTSKPVIMIYGSRASGAAIPLTWTAAIEWPPTLRTS